MKLSEYNKRADEYTAKASEITRQLILGGLAIIWLFKSTSDGKEVLPGSLLYPLITLTTALLADFLQYVIGGAIWKSFFRTEEKKAKHNNQVDPDIKAPKKLSRPLYLLYWIKIGLMVLSYVLLFIYLFREIRLVV